MWKSHRTHASVRLSAGHTSALWRSPIVSRIHVFQRSSSPGGTTRTSLQTSRPVGPRSAAAGGSPRAIRSRTRSTIQWCVRRIRRSEEHTSELQSLAYLVCRLLLEKKKTEPCSIVTTYEPSDRACERGSTEAVG